MRALVRDQRCPEQEEKTEQMSTTLLVKQANSDTRIKPRYRLVQAACFLTNRLKLGILRNKR